MVAVGDIEFCGIYLGRYEKIGRKKLGPDLVHARLADQMRGHARATNSELILDWIRGADIAFANLETTLAKPRPYYHPRPTYYRLRADPSNAEDLKLLGIDVVSLANNHQFDYGDSGFADTVEALDGVGIKHVGAGMNLEEAFSHVIFDARGRKIAFLGFATVFQTAAASDRAGVAAIRNKITYEFESARLPTEYTPFYAPLPKINELPVEEDLLRIRNCIKRVREKADFVVVSVHWGKGTVLRGYEDTPSDSQRLLGHAMIDAGADLVIGHHPHSAQAVEIYRDKHIFYSMGNFAMQIEADIARSELFLDMAFMVKVDIEENESSRVELLPTRIDETGLPRITEDYANLVKHLSEISSPLDALLVPHKQGALVEPVTK